MTTINWDNAGEWVSDENGNRCSVEYFGSKENAEAALKSLKGCRDCVNCSDCSYCSRCSDCSRCSRCSRCSGCSYCSGCSRCSRCSDCSYCSRCSGCSYCSRCSEKNGALAIPPTPKIDGIHNAVFTAVSAEGALDMRSWHSCDTTHCRAGWVVHLAGDAGYALERFFNTELAAMKIYEASGYKISPARFYDDPADALADMKRLADAERAATPTGAA